MSAATDYLDALTPSELDRMSADELRAQVGILAAMVVAAEITIDRRSAAIIATVADLAEARDALERTMLDLAEMREALLAERGES